jgi:membrane-associated phospholipid phosphatase
MRWTCMAAALLVAAPAAAQTEPPRAHWPTDVAVTVGALAVAGLATRLPGGGEPWSRELLPIDERVKLNFSPPAARLSDVLAGVTVLGPLALQLRGGFDEAGAARALVYGETIAANLALNGVTKALVARPRPYSYSDDPAARAEVQRSPRDAHLSFYSGHASTTFAAAVSGAYLFSQSSDDPLARTAVWASSLMLAGATSDLRVRAGKHFYSDVLAGAAIGAGVGVLVPALHGGPAHALLPSEWIAIGTAPLAGALLGEVIPLPERAPLQARAVPWVTGKGAGVMVAGVF